MSSSPLPGIPGDAPTDCEVPSTPPGTWTRDQLLSHSGNATELLQSPLQARGRSSMLHTARKLKRQSAIQRDKGELRLLRQRVHAAPQYVVVEKDACKDTFNGCTQTDFDTPIAAALRPGMHLLSDDQLQLLLVEASQRGATKVIDEVGSKINAIRVEKQSVTKQLEDLASKYERLKMQHAELMRGNVATNLEATISEKESRIQSLMACCQGLQDRLKKMELPRPVEPRGPRYFELITQLEVLRGEVGKSESVIAECAPMTASEMKIYIDDKFGMQLPDGLIDAMWDGVEEQHRTALPCDVASVLAKVIQKMIEYDDESTSGDDLLSNDSDYDPTDFLDNG